MGGRAFDWLVQAYAKNELAGPPNTLILLAKSRSWDLAAMLNSREVIRRLETAGWRLARAKGDHHQFKHPERPGVTTVLHPIRDFAIKTLISMVRQSGVKLRD